MTDENIIGIDFEYHVETWFSDERRNPFYFLAGTKYAQCNYTIVERTISMYTSIDALFGETSEYLNVLGAISTQFRPNMTKNTDIEVWSHTMWPFEHF